MIMPSTLARRMALMLALGPLSFLGVMIGATDAQARENYALIVTASDYPNLDQKWWLKGPKNDAALVRDYLLGNAPVPFKPENVTVLGSGDGMTLATHKVIMDDLARLAKEAKAGDFVFLQFSGHGSQQPATDDATETDGRDEIFLAADTEMAPADNPSFAPNVVTDNEMAAALKAIRKTGAFVWVVFDSCHSGTMTRGAPDENVVTREISPHDLGIADTAFRSGPTKPAERTAPLAGDVYEEDSSQGGLVAFFAAQTTELAPETAYDVVQPDGSTTKLNYGVFTHTIFSVLAKNPNMTYRQLAQSVLAGYTADNWLKPTPLFEGKLDAQVFASDEIVPTAQWPIVAGQDGSMSISAGQLQGLAAGTKLLLVPSPAASSDNALGVMEVKSSTQLRSKLMPSSDSSHPLIEASAIPPGAYLRLGQVSYPFALTVARPDPKSGDAAQIGAVNAALDKIAGTKDTPLKLNVVDAGAAADLRLAVLSDTQVARMADPKGPVPTSLDRGPKLWLLPSSGEVSLEPRRRAPAMAMAAGPDGKSFEDKLSDSLVTIFRATGLSRLTAASTFAPRDFKLGFSLQEAGQATLTDLAPEDTPIIRPNDLLYVDFTNASGKAVDLNLLYVDHDYGIQLLCSAHLASNGHLFQPFANIDPSDAGSERVVAVINESGHDITDLHFLTQPGLSGLRGEREPGLIGMLSDLGSGEATRASPPSLRDANTPRGAVVMLPLEVLPATGAGPAIDVPLSDPRTPEGECET